MFKVVKLLTVDLNSILLTSSCYLRAELFVCVLVTTE